MKKVKVSTVRQLSDVEVIYINSSLIYKVIRACDVIQNIINTASMQGCINPQFELVHDDDGVVTGKKPVLDDTGSHVVEYRDVHICSEDLRAMAERVEPILNELTEAFLNDGEDDKDKK